MRLSATMRVMRATLGARASSFVPCEDFEVAMIVPRGLLVGFDLEFSRWEIGGQPQLVSGVSGLGGGLSAQQGK